MELAFSTKMLRDICESEVLVYQLFDADIAKCLMSRLADLRAVDKLGHLPAGNPKQIIRNGEEYIQLELGNKIMIILCANHNNNPMHSDIEVNWEKVSRIKICTIGDYSG